MFSATCAGVVAPKSTLDTRSFARANAIATAAGVVVELGSERAQGREDTQARLEVGIVQELAHPTGSWPDRRTFRSTRRRRARTTRQRRHLTHRGRRPQAGSRRIREARGCREVAPRTAETRRARSRSRPPAHARPAPSSRSPTRAPCPTRSAHRPPRRSPRPAGPPAPTTNTRGRDSRTPSVAASLRAPRTPTAQARTPTRACSQRPSGRVSNRPRETARRTPPPSSPSPAAPTRTRRCSARRRGT